MGDRRAGARDDPGAGAIHVSCFITAANRAAPVFELVPQRSAVRCVGNPLRDGPNAADSAAPSLASPPPPHSAEWAFHAVFRPPPGSHAADFFRDVTLPALRTACDGVNINVVAWGVHPTQKFRLLFGKSTGSLPLSPPASASASAPLPSVLSQRDAMELYGQLGALLHEFFTRVQSADEWRLGLSSWLVVSNRVVDLLKPPSPSPAASSSGSSQPMAFVSLEARSLRSACRILQMAKTNRIVAKQNAEHAHLFVRVALFHRGQLSTLHFVDLVDLREFEDPAAADEKRELLEIMHELRQPPPSARQAAGAKQRPRGASVSPPPSPTSDRKTVGSRTPPRSSSPSAAPPPPPMRNYTTTLASFVLPLLTANAQTFLYANVIDSRSSLRESVALLNAVANLRGFACPCRRLSGVAYAQLGFQAPPPDIDTEDAHTDAAPTPSFEIQAAVSVGESLLSQLAAPSPVTHAPGSSNASNRTTPMPSREREERARPASADSIDLAGSSETMRWLDEFQQRKREILGARIDTVAPAAEIVALANSRVEAARSYSDASLEREEQSPTSNSVSNIYEQLRRSMDSHAAMASHVANAMGATDRRRDAPPRELPFMPRRDGRERCGADLDALAAASPARPPSQCSIRSSSSSEEPRYPGVQQRVSTPNAPVKARRGDQPSSSSADAEWDRIVSPSCTEWGPPAASSTPEYHHQERYLRPASTPGSSLPQAPQQVSTPSGLQSPLAPPYRALPNPDFEAQCAHVGVPSTPLAAPNVDGLDPATADRVQAADAALLRKNYDALLTIVREQQLLREEAEARAAEAVHDSEELRASFEVQIENMKLEHVALKRKARLLEKRSGVQDALEQYERDVQSLQTQVHQLQERNVALELRLASTDGLTASGGGIDLKKKYQHVVDEKLKLEQELAAYRKRERQMLVYTKLVGDSTRKVDQLTRDLSEKEQSLAATRLGKLRLSAEMNQAVEKAELLHKENAQLLVDKAATTEELVATKMYLASLEAEQKKAEVLDRFVKKHGYRMRELRQDQPVPGSGRYASASRRQAQQQQPWRRDSEAKECEERLFATVKRSLPQAVPLVNKLLRRLELQELSLREFSEREVDFINMLVELVSDQPAATLKRMIEDEMQKLQLC